MKENIKLLKQILRDQISLSNRNLFSRFPLSEADGMQFALDEILRFAPDEPAFKVGDRVLVEAVVDKIDPCDNSVRLKFDCPRDTHNQYCFIWVGNKFIRKIHES